MRIRHWASMAAVFGLLTTGVASGEETALGSGVTKIKDVMIYQDSQFYCAFPSVVCRPDGELIVAFRRAPDRHIFGEDRYSHTDPNSYLVLVRSRDNGETWTRDPELICAYPFGGSQDPCMLQLSDGTILCASYAWARLELPEDKKPAKTAAHGDFHFLGGYLVRSEDGGKTWSAPYYPPAVPGDIVVTPMGEPCPAYNRGALCQGKDGRVFWAVAATRREKPLNTTEIHLMISDDGGKTWTYSCPIAIDEKVTFNETSLYETPGGDLVAFVRTASFDDHTVVVRSKDGGKSFEPWQDSGWQGHPHHALRLPDGRVFLLYGYRHEPWGIRARILNSECADFATAEEIVIRADGKHGDLGYPWATLTADGHVLATYYFHDAAGNRHIAGSLLSISAGDAGKP